jgi:hypothetical protein
VAERLDNIHQAQAQRRKKQEALNLLQEWQQTVIKLG